MLCSTKNKVSSLICQLSVLTIFYTRYFIKIHIKRHLNIFYKAIDIILIISVSCNKNVI